MSSRPASRRTIERFGKPMQSFGHLARVTFRTFARTLEKRIIEHGVTIGQWRFLRELWLEDGITQRELSTRLGLREPSTVAAVRSLEAAGFIRRVRDEQDKRKVRIFLTAKAENLRLPLLAQVMEVNRIAARGIPQADQAVARRVFQQMIDNLDKHAGDGIALTDPEP